MSKRNLWLSALMAALVAVAVDLGVIYAIRRSLDLGDVFTALAVGLTTGVAVLLLFRNWTGRSCR